MHLDRPLHPRDRQRADAILGRPGEIANRSATVFQRPPREALATSAQYAKFVDVLEPGLRLELTAVRKQADGSDVTPVT
jgi:hypothetical protein